MAEKTLSDYVKKDRKGIPFEERAKSFEKEIKVLVEEWGVVPWAGIQQTPEAVVAVPLLKDLWDSGKE